MIWTHCHQPRNQTSQRGSLGRPPLPKQHWTSVASVAPAEQRKEIKGLHSCSVLWIPLFRWGTFLPHAIRIPQGPSMQPALHVLPASFSDITWRLKECVKPFKKPAPKAWTAARKPFPLPHYYLQCKLTWLRLMTYPYYVPKQLYKMRKMTC